MNKRWLKAIRPTDSDLGSECGTTKDTPGSSSSGSSSSGPSSTTQKSEVPTSSRQQKEEDEEMISVTPLERGRPNTCERPWKKKVKLRLSTSEESESGTPKDTPGPSSTTQKSEVPTTSRQHKEEEEEMISVTPLERGRPNTCERPWKKKVKLRLSTSEESDGSKSEEEQLNAIDRENEKIFEKFEKMGMKKGQKLENRDSAPAQGVTNSFRTPKTRELTFYEKEKRRLEYNFMKKDRQKEKARKKAAAEARPKRVDRAYVQPPTILITTDPLTRPLPQNLCADVREDHGSAFQFMDARFGYGTEDYDSRRPWRIVDPQAPSKFIEDGRQHRQQQLELLMQNLCSQDVRIREKQQKTLEALQEIIWLMHFKRKDLSMSKAVDTMTKRSMFHFDKQGEVAFASENCFSMIGSDHFDEDMSDIVEQRRRGDMMRPVFIDGFSILTQFYPDFSTDQPPKLPVKILLTFIAHFLLDGHQVIMLLPNCYENPEKSNDPIALKFLIERQLIEFVDSSEAEVFEEFVVESAEKTHGILVTLSEDVLVQQAIICRPITQRFTDNVEDFTLMTGFDKDSVGVEAEKIPDVKEPKNADDSEDEEEELDAYQALNKRCRMYSEKEVNELSTEVHQLLLKDQVFLISSLCHLTHFHSRHFRLIKAFLMLINKFAPDFVPVFMQKELESDIKMLMQQIREGKNPEIWPLYAKY